MTFRVHPASRVISSAKLGGARVSRDDLRIAKHAVSRFACQSVGNAHKYNRWVPQAQDASYRGPVGACLVHRYSPASASPRTHRRVIGRSHYNQPIRIADSIRPVIHVC